MKNQVNSLPAFGGFLLAILVLPPASASVIELGFEPAAGNATVQASGNRTGTGGTNFFNLQNNLNNQFSSYGVIEWNLGAGAFTGAPAGLTAAEIGPLQLRLTQSNAGFSRDTSLRFYLWNNFTPGLAPGDTDMTFDSESLTGISDPPQAWFDTPHSLWELGTGNYAVTANGHVDTFTFNNFPLAARSHIASQLNSNGSLRIVAVSTRDDDFAGAATYAGFTNSTFTGPELSLTIIPEPGVLFSVLFGALLLSLPLRKLRR